MGKGLRGLQGVISQQKASSHLHLMAMEVEREDAKDAILQSLATTHQVRAKQPLRPSVFNCLTLCPHSSYRLLR
jgi:hypothetical protein